MKLMVLDGNSIVNRAYYGIRPLTTRQGLHTNAIYGFVTTLQRLLDEEKPEALCVAFDRREPTFRHQADASYKAQRKGMPEELAMQLLPLKQVLTAMSIPQYELTGYEADDLIGTISRKCEADGWDCVVVTGDKDSLQLITDHTKVKLVSTRMGQTTTKDMTPETFRETYGFAPIHMIDLKALMGDSSDNIPGVPGIGEKTAMALVQEYGSIDALYAQMPDVHAKPAALRKLQEGEEAARHSYWLATIVTDAPLDFKPEDNLRQPFKPELYDLFLRLEFQKLIDKYGLSPSRTVEEKPSHTAHAEIVETAARAEELLTLWRAAAHVTVYGLPDLSALAVECEAGEDATLMAELYENRYAGNWHDLLASLFAADIKKVGHHIKDTMRALLERELPAEGFMFDTALAAYLCDATAGSYDIPKLFLSFYNEELPKPAHLSPEAFTSLLGDDAAAQTALISYTSAVSALHGTLAPKLRELDMEPLYYDVELPLCRVLAEMETAGFLVDRKALAQYGETLQGVMDETEQAIYAAAGETFNINSPKQLERMCFSRQAEKHLCGRALEGHRPGRPGAYQLPDDGDGHGPSQLHRAEFAEYPHPHGAGQPAAADVHRAGGLRAGGRGLLPDRAAAAGPHRRRRRDAGGLPLGGGLPHRHRLPRVPRSAGAGDAGAAPPRQGGELRHCLRHLRLLAGAGHRRHRGGGQGVYGAVF